MDDIHLSLEQLRQTVTVTLNTRIENELDALREASKILQREVMRREANNDKRFHR